MTRHWSHSAAFKRQVAEEFIAGETLHALSKRHDISRQLIRIWVGKFEPGLGGGRAGGRPALGIRGPRSLLSSGWSVTRRSRSNY
jgi:transposase-like protein